VTYPSGPYAPYGYGPPPVRRPEENGLAIAALVCSLAGIFTFGVSSLVGIVLGHIAFHKAAKGVADGRNLALGAFVSGYVILALWTGFTVTFVILLAHV
jgi:hypothetical protein